MEAVVKYRSIDGETFDNAEQCVMRDRIVEEVAKALSLLKPTPTNCNWEGYVQQNSSVVLEVKRRLFQIANRDGVLKWWIDRQINDHGATHESLISDCHPSWFGRMIDGGCAPLEKAYMRLCCMDKDCREWNQPYLANNPGHGVMKCVG